MPYNCALKPILSCSSRTRNPEQVSYTIFSCLIRLPYNIVFFHPVSSHLPLFSSLSSSLFSPCPLLSPYLDLPRQISLSSLAILVYIFFSYSQDITCIVSSSRLISPRLVSISFLAIPYHLPFFFPRTLLQSA